VKGGSQKQEALWELQHLQSGAASTPQRHVQSVPDRGHVGLLAVMPSHQQGPERALFHCLRSIDDSRSSKAGRAASRSRGLCGV
jgi:hypothetical protein